MEKCCEHLDLAPMEEEEDDDIIFSDKIVLWQCYGCGKYFNGVGKEVDSYGKKLIYVENVK